MKQFGLLTKWVSRRLSGPIRRIRRTLAVNIEHPYTAFSITLPPYSLIPLYQQTNKLYDRFLPHLAKYIEPNSTVIDVGANCGDTLAALYEANKTLKYICIEPDDTFFSFLQKNAARIRTLDPNVSISVQRSLVGKAVTNVSLVGFHGTKHAVTSDNTPNALQSQTLDDLVSFMGATNIRLLKSDVDGFDYDVIDSAAAIIASQAPILFFECYFDYYAQKLGFETTIARLQMNGYHTWVLLDNFGEVVLRTEDVSAVFQLLDYVWRQNLNRSTRTIHYYDILTATKKDDSLLAKVVSDFVST